MNYFIRVENATDVRREALESSRQVIEVLKGYHRLLDIRDRKREVALELQRSMAGIATLMGELEKILPERSLRELAQFLPKPEKAAPESKPKEAPPKAKRHPKGSKAAREALQEVIVEARKDFPQDFRKPRKAPVAKESAPAKPESEMQKLDKELELIETRLRELS